MKGHIIEKHNQPKNFQNLNAKGVVIIENIIQHKTLQEKGMF